MQDSLRVPRTLSEYTAMSPADIRATISAIRRHFSTRLLILAHHYVPDDVLEHGDLCGDSFQLSAAAAQTETTEYIVFCGVHFMAESADILANHAIAVGKRGGRRILVMLPDLTAGCDMADMATCHQVQQCWDSLAEHIDMTKVVPITYVNSSAALKSFCGRHGGVACTSSNAAAVLRWAMAGGKRVLFVPDQHLGRNTALQLNVASPEMTVWNPKLPLGGNTAETIQRCKIILWDGYCYVHQAFTCQDVAQRRAANPQLHVMVHPECPLNIVEAADEAGSTSYIIDRVERAPSGSCWAIGTEWNLVHRLAAKFPGKTILNLREKPSVCDSMNRITPAKLCWTLANLAAGTPKNVIQVPPEDVEAANLCLTRMLQLR